MAGASAAWHRARDLRERTLEAQSLRASGEATAVRTGGHGQWLLALPPHHIAGLQVILRSLRAGYEPVVVDVTRGFDPETLPAAVDACRAGAGAATGAGAGAGRRGAGAAPG